MSSQSDTATADADTENQKNELLDRVLNFLTTYLP